MIIWQSEVMMVTKTNRLTHRIARTIRWARRCDFKNWRSALRDLMIRGETGSACSYPQQSIGFSTSSAEILQTFKFSLTSTWLNNCMIKSVTEYAWPQTSSFSWSIFSTSSTWWNHSIPFYTHWSQLKTSIPAIHCWSRGNDHLASHRSNPAASQMDRNMCQR